MPHRYLFQVPSISSRQCENCTVNRVNASEFWRTIKHTRRMTPWLFSLRSSPLAVNCSQAILKGEALVNCLCDRYDETHDRQYLDWAITLLRLMLDYFPHEFPRWNFVLNLSWCRLKRYNLFRDSADLERAIALARDAVVLCPAENEAQYLVLDNLTCSLLLRRRHFDTVDDLDEIIVNGRLAMKALSEMYPDRSRRLENIDESWIPIEQYLKERRVGFIDSSRTLRAELISDWPKTLNRLGEVLCDHSKFSRDLGELDESIALHRDALEFWDGDHPYHATSLSNLACVLHDRFLQRGKENDLAESIQLYRAALPLLEGDSDISATLCNFGRALETRFEHSGMVEDLNEAIQLFRDNLALSQELYIKYAIQDSNIRVFFDACAEERVILMDDLNGCFRDAVAATGGDAAQIMELGAYALVLHAFFKQDETLDSTKGTDGLMKLYREALALRPEERSKRFVALSNLAVALTTRFSFSGKREDIDEVIRLYQDILALGCPQSYASFDVLATMLRCRFAREGKVEYLNQSVNLCRRALSFVPEGSTLRARYLGDLATSLFLRLEQGGRAEDLDELITLLREALNLLPNETLSRHPWMDLLGFALKDRFRRRGNMDDLDESIRLLRDALALCPEVHAFRHTSLSSLGGALLEQFWAHRRKEDIEEAINLLRNALSLFPEGHPGKPNALCNVAYALWARDNGGGDSADLNESIELFRHALELLPDDHSYRSRISCDLGVGHYLRYKKEGKHQDYEYCIQLHCSASAYKFSSLFDLLRVACSWVSIARVNSHETTLVAYRTALSLLDRALAISPTLSTKHDLLVNSDEYQTLAVDAASFAIEKGDFATAIELLEQGRALLWSGMRGLRSQLDQLSAVDGALAERFGSCSHQVEALMTSSELRHSIPRVAEFLNPSDANREHARLLTDELEGIIEEIRQVPGFEDFFRPAPFANLKYAASEGPVIVINHSRYRCDALIILSHEDMTCLCVPLDEEWFKDASILCDDLSRARKEHPVHSVKYDETLRRVMQVLWDRVVSQVVVKLKGVGVPYGSRIWWCPTRCLAGLPFHAAGPYTDADGNMKYLLDDYISSYTPTLRSLIDSRAGNRFGSEKLLFVGDTKLASTKKERDAIRRRLRITKCLIDKEASGDSVLKALADAGWVHFACHGGLNMENPFESSFVLPGGKLTLLDIARARLPNAEFAFLSACHTAEQSPKLAMDEALHLAAGMQFCGFRSVIGTMWKLLDRDGPLLAESVYMHLMNDVGDGEPKFKGAAAAVRRASLFLRSQKDWTNDGRIVDIATERWVNLVHIGA